MDSDIETLMVDVRASTDGFESDIQRMRDTFDSTLVDGFGRAGNILESSLLGAVRRGSLGFDDLKRTALRALDEIAASALQAGLSQIGGGLLGGGLTGLIGGVLGLPGRATGGNVSPGSAYLVGERGPEVFVPTSSGRIETGNGGSGRDVRVSINLNAPAGSSSAESLQRSSRQVASAVRRALSAY
ncbi:tail tape measure protein [Croceicoccus bisphenolivorans]|uniref:tail tape measure protein n=1 Tax=Croceicoccus bisphenolivorans TaxID=1783232 RepID=UPI00082EC3AB|nr:tail tape measure protein [Croceicoccus bisphenolivorans]